MIRDFNQKGFSLVEIMIAVAMLGGISLGVMQMLKGMQKGQVDVQNFTDYTGIAQESNFLLNDLNSCKVSLQGTTFHGSTIKATPITGIQLWSADQAGVRSQKKFYAGASFGKVTIDSVNFSMPDYTATSDWVAGTNQSFTGVVTISSKKKSLGHETTDKLITKSINVTFDTDATGTSIIKSCSAANAAAGGSLGDGQTWKSMGYALNTSYTNNTGKPIYISVTLNRGGQCDSGANLYIDGVLIQTYYASCVNLSSTVTGIIPNGSTYMVKPSMGGNALTSWYELR